MGNFVIDDGAKEFTFTNKEGRQFAKFWFNPGDVNMAERYSKMGENMSAAIVDNFEKDDALKFLGIIERVLKEQFNFLLNYNCEEDLFSTYNPLTVFANGDFFCEVVFEKIGEVMEKEFDIRLDKKIKKIKKMVETNK